MARPTERALKRKPKAVILLTTRREDVPDVPPAGREFEWFTSDKGMSDYFDQNVEFNKQDAQDHDDMAFVAVEVTSTANMALGRIDVQPVTEETEKWADAIKADITKAYALVKEESTKSSDDEAKKVRPRRKSTAAAAVKKADPDAKAQRLKERLAAKKGDQKKSETGDKAPKPRAPRNKATSDA